MTTAGIAADPITATRTVRRALPSGAAQSSELPRPQARRRDSPWLRRLLVFVTCAILADALVGERGLARMYRARHDYAHAEAQLAALRIENATLREHARRLQADPTAIEAVARQELGLVRPGEILVVVTDLH